MGGGALIYEGKAKKLFETEDPDYVIQYFKDDATAFNAQKKGTILNKGVVNNRVSERLFTLLEKEGVPTHFIRRPSDREMLVKRLAMFPIEVVVRNIIAGSLAKRLGLQDGTEIPFPVLEFYYKADALGDPMINEYHVQALGFASNSQLTDIKTLTFKINDVLRPYLLDRGMILVDFKLEFGDFHGQVTLADEICPDTCRLWDRESRERMDKDRFRMDLGGVEEAYAEVCRRICED
jgi:phosphoribosylaminoimidazole-succinocarboxamide synthase